MTPEERDLTTMLLDRLNKTEGQRDPEAEVLIRQATAEGDSAHYYLVQTVLIQDLSLHNAQRRITDLETQLTETNLTSSAPPSFLGAASFLGAVFGGSEPLGDARTSNLPPSGPPTGPAALAAMPRPGSIPELGAAAPPASAAGLAGGGGFLRSAAMTAAGIAGGALVFEGIQSIFGQCDTATITGNQAALPGLGETFLNKRCAAEASRSTDEQAGAGGNPDLPDPTAGSGKDFTSRSSSSL
jgi:uncharacterized protein